MDGDGGCKTLESESGSVLERVVGGGGDDGRKTVKQWFD